MCSVEASVLLQFFCTLPQTCASVQSCLQGLQTLTWTSWLSLCSDMTCNYETLYRQLCFFPNHVQWTEFTTGGHSSCRNIWTDDQWKQDAAELSFECHASLQTVFNFNFVIIQYWEKKCNPFWNKVVKWQCAEQVKDCEYFLDAL